MNRFFLGLGTNLGDRAAQLKATLAALGAFGQVAHVSPCFETPPLLPAGAPPEWFQFFLNAVVVLETPHSASELLKLTQKIETDLGRSTVREKWAPRPIDIDILFADPFAHSHSAELNLPHPEWTKRSFVLSPLAHLPGPAGLTQAPLYLLRKLKTVTPALMTAINVTPDSFSEQPGFIDYESIKVKFDGALKNQVAFIDLGAESTRPGATPLLWQQEWERLKPVLEYWKSVSAQYPFTRLSIDTYHPETAQRALDYNVSVLNDVTHLSSPAMGELATHFESVILMHSLSVPADKNVTFSPQTDVVKELKTWIYQKIDQLQRVSTEKLIFDPGLGFGKTALQSLQILQRSDEFDDLPMRRLIGHSRKSFMSSVATVAAADRDVETVAMSLALAQKKIEILRVHNIEWHLRAFRAAGACFEAGT